MKYLIWTIFSLLVSNYFAQKAHQICLLSDEVNETSGLLYISNHFYTFNDSGGEAAIYEIDTVSGSVLRKIEVKGAANIDWEAITADSEFIYIGDIGNNYGNRKDLVIYKCPIDGLTTGVLIAEKIQISYEDQTDFKHEAHKHEYDAESLFIKDGDLFLISKNWVKNKSKIYLVPKEPGKYSLEVITKIDVFGKVTDAYYDDDNSALALIGYGDFPFISLYMNLNGFECTQEITIPINSPNGLQTEGISIVDGIVFYSSEQVKMFSAELARYQYSEIQNLAIISNKKDRIRIKSSEKIDVLKIETTKGKDLFEQKDFGKKSIKIPVRSLNTKKEVVWVSLRFENGASIRQKITL